MRVGDSAWRINPALSTENGNQIFRHTTLIQWDVSFHTAHIRQGRGSKECLYCVVRQVGVDHGLYVRVFTVTLLLSMF